MPARLRRPKGTRPEGLEPSGERPKGTAAGWLGTEEDAFDLWLQQSLALPRFHGQCYAAEAAAWNAIIFCSGVM
jgi:hypothetical protein